MAFAISLRFDLRKLSDAELARRCDEEWRIYEAAADRSASFWPRWLRGDPPGLRGFVHHPRVYRFFAAFGLAPPGNASFLMLLAAPFMTGKTGEEIIRRTRDGNMHLSMCEIRDLTDEMQRRVEQRRRAIA